MDQNLWVYLLDRNKHGDGLEEKKNLLLVIPPNAIPFSDEWLSAMEAAGEVSLCFISAMPPRMIKWSLFLFYCI